MLKININENKISDGSVALSWCLDIEDIKLLMDKVEICPDPQLLICVTPEIQENILDSGKEELRFLVPIKDLMTFIHFKYPGKNNIQCCIVKSKERGHSYLRKSGKHYSYTLLNYQNKINIGDYDGFNFIKTESLTIDVPKEVFAADPPEWEKKWINLFSKNKSIDECSYRKKRIFAYTVQPLLLFFSFILKSLIFLFALMTLQKGLNLKYFNLFTHSFTDFDLLFDKSSYCVNDEETNFLKRNWKIVFSPLFLMLISILGLITFKFTVIVLMGIAIGFALVAFIIVLLCIIDPTLREIILKSFRKNSTPTTPSYSKDDIIEITCSNKVYKDLKDLPSRKRTVKLHYLNLKAKICKPFAG